MSTWKRVAENLVRHESGTIYLRAKVAGKPIRYSLKTIELAAAKAEPTLGEALTAVEKELITDPRLKPRTVSYNQELHQVPRETLPVKLAPRHWTAANAREWWTTIAGRFSSQRANNLLAQAKKTRHLPAAVSGVRHGRPDPLHRGQTFAGPRCHIPQAFARFQQAHDGAVAVQ